MFAEDVSICRGCQYLPRISISAEDPTAGGAGQPRPGTYWYSWYSPEGLGEEDVEMSGANIDMEVEAAQGLVDAVAAEAARRAARRELRARRALRLRRLLDAKGPRHHALDIAIDDRCRSIKRNRGNCGSGIGANAWKLAQGCFGIRENAAMIARHRLRARMQISRSGVVAKTLPSMQYLVE